MFRVCVRVCVCFFFGGGEVGGLGWLGSLGCRVWGCVGS